MRSITASARAAVRRSGGSVRTIFARTTAKIETIQPVLRGHIPANSELKPEDVEWKPALLDNSGTVPTSLEEFLKRDSLPIKR